MPPRRCSGWSKHDPLCLMLLERVRPITMPLALYSHLVAHPPLKSLQGPVPVLLRAGSASEIVTLRLVSHAVGAHLHLRRSLCLQGDGESDIKTGL